MEPAGAAGGQHAGLASRRSAASGPAVVLDYRGAVPGRAVRVTVRHGCWQAHGNPLQYRDCRFCRPRRPGIRGTQCLTGGVTLRPAGRGRSGPAATPAPRSAPAGAALSSGPGTRSGRSPRTRERSVTRPRASLLNVTGQVHGVDLRLAPLSTRGVSGHYGEPLDPAPDWTGHRSPAYVHDSWLGLGSGNSSTSAPGSRPRETCTRSPRRPPGTAGWRMSRSTRSRSRLLVSTCGGGRTSCASSTASPSWTPAWCTCHCGGPTHPPTCPRIPAGTGTWWAWPENLVGTGPNHPRHSPGRGTRPAQPCIGSRYTPAATAARVPHFYA